MRCGSAAAAIGFTIYPGSAHQFEMFSRSGSIAEEAKRHGLAVVIWSYPRGSALSKEGETAIDVIGYAAQIAAQLGAHIIKVKLPTAHHRAGGGQEGLSRQEDPDRHAGRARQAHVVQCAFDGRRIVIFSGGAAVFDDNKLLDEIRAIHDGGGFGSIIGRNSFQRSREDALKLLSE